MPNVYISGVKKCDFVQNLALFYFILCKKNKNKKKPQKNNRNQLIAGHSINELVDDVPIRIHFVN